MDLREQAWKRACAVAEDAVRLSEAIAKIRTGALAVKSMMAHGAGGWDVPVPAAASVDLATAAARMARDCARLETLVQLIAEAGAP